MTPRTRPIVQAVHKAYYDPWELFGDNGDGSPIFGMSSCNTPEKDEAYLDMLNQELNDAKGG